MPFLNASEKVFYGGDTKFSYSACQWIELETKKLGKHIHQKMCGHGGEREVEIKIEDENGKKKNYRYPVDRYEPETNTVYQYHGCYWHGYSCLDKRTRRQLNRFTKTKDLDRHIKNNDYKLVITWGCEDTEKDKPWFAREERTFFKKKFTPYPHFIVYDFEARMKPMNIKQTDDLTYILRHVPVNYL